MNERLGRRTINSDWKNDLRKHDERRKRLEQPIGPRTSDVPLPSRASATDRVYSNSDRLQEERSVGAEPSITPPKSVFTEAAKDRKVQLIPIVAGSAIKRCAGNESMFRDPVFRSPAKAECAKCELKTECREDDLRNGPEPGIKAGLSQEERIKLHDALQKQRPEFFDVPEPVAPSVEPDIPPAIAD